MNKIKNALWDIVIMFPYGFVFGFVAAAILLGADLYTCQQTLNEPTHCADVCADQLLRFENKGLITIHCQKCETKGNNQ